MAENDIFAMKITFIVVIVAVGGVVFVFVGLLCIFSICLYDIPVLAYLL